MGRKQDFAKVSRDIDAYRAGLGQAAQPIQAWQTGVAAHRTAPRPDVDLMRGQYRGMITDPTQRGLSPATVARMWGRESEAASGAMKSYQADVNRQLAAGGQTKTGAGLRLAGDYARQMEERNRAGMRDIESQNEILKRNELFTSLQNLQGLQGQEDAFSLNALGLEGSGFNQLTNLEQLKLGSFGPQIEALVQKNKPGFWSQLGQGLLTKAGDAFLGGFGGQLGKGVASKIP